MGGENQNSDNLWISIHLSEVVLKEPIPLIIFGLKSLNLLRTENEKANFSSALSKKK